MKQNNIFQQPQHTRFRDEHMFLTCQIKGTQPFRAFTFSYFGLSCSKMCKKLPASGLPFYPHTQKKKKKEVPLKFYHSSSHLISLLFLIMWYTKN